MKIHSYIDVYFEDYGSETILPNNKFKQLLLKLKIVIVIKF